MQGKLLKDVLKKISKTLPASATTATSATGIDLEQNTTGDFVAPIEMKLSAPALTVGQLANASTMTYNIKHSDNADLSSSASLIAGAIVQTGAAGAGAAAATYNFKPPVGCKRYVFFNAVNSAAADASAATATLEMLF